MKFSSFSITPFSLIGTLMLLLSCATGYNKYANNYYEEGLLFFEKMEYGRSIESFSRVLELAPEGNQNFRVYFNRGMAYFKNRRYDEAIYDFTMAMESAPKKDKKFARESYEWRGNAYQQNNNQEKAILDYSQALRLKPDHENSKRLYNNMGWCWLGKGELYNAIKNFNQAIAKDKKYDAAYYGRANVWIKKGDWQRALIDAKKAVKLSPSNKPYDDLLYEINTTMKSK